MFMITFDLAHVAATVAVMGSLTLLQLPWWLLRRHSGGNMPNFLGWMRSMPQACTLRQLVKAAEGKKKEKKVRERGYLVTVGNLVSHQLGEHSLLGVGAFSAVYAVHLLDVPYPICLKVLSPKHASLGRVLLECDNLRLLEEVDGLPRVLAVSLEPLGFFMTQHGSSGSTMDRWKKSSMKPSEALVIGSVYRLCTILSNVHSLRVCHNDIKLNNVAVEVEASGRVDVTLLDFGLMRPFGSYPWGYSRVIDPSKSLKPFYDPELIVGKKPCSEQTDVYAVGYLVSCLLPLLSVTREVMDQYSRLAMDPDAASRPTTHDLVFHTHHALVSLLPHVSPLSLSPTYPSIHLQDPPSSLRGHRGKEAVVDSINDQLE